VALSSFLAENFVFGFNSDFAYTREFLDVRLLGGFSTTMTLLQCGGFGGLISKAEVRFASQFNWRNVCH
jgi:hypothetical protein